MQINSEYRLFKGFGLLVGLNLYIISLPWTVFRNTDTSLFSLSDWQNPAKCLVMLIYVSVEGLFLWLFVSQCKYIKINEESICFVNPVLPFLRKKINWADYDGYYTTMESSRFAKFEAIWLVKDNKLVSRISSYYYINYEGLKTGLKTNYIGELNIGEFRKFLCLFGAKITK